MNKLIGYIAWTLLWVSPALASDRITLAQLPAVPSDVGKSPFFGIFEGPAPHGMGPGLRFDTKKYFYIYTDRGSPANHFAPSGWMGDYGDIRLDDASTDDPADGRTCIKITYLARESQGYGWAGMFWQEPQNNWGTIPGGFNLKTMKRLTFWARGTTDDETIAVFKVGGLQGEWGDSDSAQIGPVSLTREWQQFTIDLSAVDLSKISNGFGWATSRTDNQGPITFYLDEIRFER